MSIFPSAIKACILGLYPPHVAATLGRPGDEAFIQLLATAIVCFAIAQYHGKQRIIVERMRWCHVHSEMWATRRHHYVGFPAIVSPHFWVLREIANIFFWRLVQQRKTGYLPVLFTIYHTQATFCGLPYAKQWSLCDIVREISATETESFIEEVDTVPSDAFPLLVGTAMPFVATASAPFIVSPPRPASDASSVDDFFEWSVPETDSSIKRIDTIPSGAPTVSVTINASGVTATYSTTARAASDVLNGSSPVAISPSGFAQDTATTSAVQTSASGQKRKAETEADEKISRFAVTRDAVEQLLDSVSPHLTKDPLSWCVLST